MPITPRVLKGSFVWSMRIDPELVMRIDRLAYALRLTRTGLVVQILQGQLPGLEVEYAAELAEVDAMVNSAS